MNPFAWYLDLLVSWGLLQDPYWTETSFSPAVFIGAIPAVLAGLFTLMMLTSVVWSDYAPNFDRDRLMRAGYWMTTVILTPLIVGLVVWGTFSLTATVLCLLAQKPLVTVLALVVLGPLLMLASTIKRGASGIKSRRKQKAAASVATSSSSAEPLELNEKDFYTIDVGGEKVIRARS